MSAPMWKAILMAASLGGGIDQIDAGWPTKPFVTQQACENAGHAWETAPSVMERHFMQCVPWCEMHDKECLAAMLKDQPK